MNLVISQPMFIPWIGMFEQIKLSDVFVHYDDVQFSKGGFLSRVQVKEPEKESWLTAPVNWDSGTLSIKEMKYSDHLDWRKSHLGKLSSLYRHAPFFEVMYQLAQEIYADSHSGIADFNIHALEAICRWLDLKPRFVRSSELGIPGSSSQRVLDICRHFGAAQYITGHGAMNYLDYNLFEEQNIRVLYMNYLKVPYKQMYRDFTPYVTILDAIANCGPETPNLLKSNAIYWRNFVNEKS